MRAGRTALRLGLLALGVLVVGLVASHRGRALLRHAAAALLGRVRLAERRRLPPEEPFFSRLALSQVGYAPAMEKRFTAPRAFRSFEVRELATGRVALRGGAPVRTLPTDLLGEVRSVSIGDFSALTRPGRYWVVSDDGTESFPFEVGSSVFDPPLRAVQRWFYFQRAFTPVLAAHAEGPWVHADDARLAPPGVEGGWHDAGDLTVYNAYLTSALFWLLLADADFGPTADDTNIPESGNGVPDLLDEARWGLRWLLSVQDDSGGFRNTSCQDGYGPYGRNAPERMPPYGGGEVGTLATARAVGTLAFAATRFRRVDAAFAERCLRAARAGVGYLDAHPETTDGPSCPSARRDGDAAVGRSTRSYAAAGMALATGETRFHRDVRAQLAMPVPDPVYLHIDGLAALLYLRAPDADPELTARLRQALEANARVAREDGARHPFGWAGRYYWGSLGAALIRTGTANAWRCRQDPRAMAEDCAEALASLHYAFGRNGRQFCYVTGLPGVSHGMRAGFHQWLATLAATPRDFPGMLAGGPVRLPEPADVSHPAGLPIPAWGYWGDPAFPRDDRTPVEARYTDNDSWSTNEVSEEWEAQALYHLHLARWLAQTP
ncbi:MAG TPA: glycoside hydrolase family 9 protein [Myxococcaceae bacterium]|nr:glycoside hydrolase family 9 protein [Myxococcaceae bacterium]